MLQTPDARKERKERESKEKKEKKNDENISIFLSSLFLSSSIFDFELSKRFSFFFFFFVRFFVFYTG